MNLMIGYISDTRLLTGGALPAEKLTKIKMQWGKKFLDAAWEHKFRIVNYPSVLEDKGQIIGDTFDLKKISTSQYKTFLPAMELVNGRKGRKVADDAEDDDDDVVVAMAIVSWDEGMYIR